MSRRAIVWLLAIWILVAVSLLTGCGSSSDNTTTVPTNDAGAASGWYFQRVQVGAEHCILASNKYDNNVGFSCDWPSETTPTTMFTP